MDKFTTCSPRLEQFLWIHGIKFNTWRKNDDMLTEWEYERTPFLMEVVEEFRELESRRRNMAKH